MQLSQVGRLIRSIAQVAGALILLTIVLIISIAIGTAFGAWVGLLTAVAGSIWTYKKLKREMQANDRPTTLHAAPKYSKSRQQQSTAATDDGWDDDDSGFRVRVTFDAGRSRIEDYEFNAGQRCRATFVDSTSAVSVHGMSLRGPLYVGDLSAVSAARDPSVIDPSLEIASHHSDEPLGYWPSYKAATPGQRARYLAWLAGPRESIDEIGYVFLYFYGMERYVLLTAAKDPPEQRSIRLQSISTELARLQRLFSHNRSFLSYSARLREALIIRHTPTLLDQLKGVFPEANTAALPFKLAQIANSGDRMPLDSDWVLQWLIHAGELRRQKIVRTHYDLLRQLFRALYEKTGGIVVPKNKTLLRLHYSAASSGLQDIDYYSVPSGWCDPSVLRRPLKPVLPLLKKATSAMRRLRKADENNSPMDFFAAWPNDIPFAPPPKYERVYKMVRAQCRRQQHMTLHALGIAFRTQVNGKPTKSHVRTLRDALATCGWVLVPDPDLTPCVLKSHDRVWVYQGLPPDGLSDAGRLLDINLRLAATVALADGEVQDDEVEYVTTLVDTHPDSLEREYFRYCARWQLAEERSATGLKAQIEALDESERRQLADRLIEIAKVDGYLPRQEVLALEKYFARLGLPKAQVVQKLHGSTTADRSAKPSSDRRDEAKDRETPGRAGVLLDLAAIEAHRHSTRKIQSVLSDIFEPPAEDEKSADDEALTSNAWHNGNLDATHHALAVHLTTQNSWTQESVQDYCQTQGLMFDGAIEAINEAAFEYLGDVLIEVDDKVYVNQELWSNA